ncbi:HpcH/HpaI aldolase/citrate lyase family protein [Gordonia humi]|uniref:HpcH/HpaI aldolase/citrate lyase family protein n=1 Tax=Gordonia humi TaxID=686429 RepID=UPI00360799E4
MTTSSPITVLYVPGNRPERFDKAATAGADAIVIDLEDAVPLREKSGARTAAAQWLRGRDRSAVPVWVRVNSGEDLIADLDAVVLGAPNGVWLPKCASAADVCHLDELLNGFGDDGRIRVSPLIETAVGLWNVREICGAPRVAFVQLGEVDLAADLGVRPSVDGSELSWARSRVVAASVAAGIAPPLGPVSPEIRDVDAFARGHRTHRPARFRGARVHSSSAAHDCP